MNKKFLSAILFGALAVASTGSFVSCKDYDDDIDNLQSQINQLATKSDMQSAVSSLQSAIATAQSAAENKAAAAEKSAADAVAAAKAATEAAAKATTEAEAAKAAAAEAKAEAALKAAQAELEEAQAQVEALAAQLEEVKAFEGLVKEADFQTEIKALNDKYAELESKMKETTGTTDMTGLQVLSGKIAAAYGIWGGIQSNDPKETAWKGPKKDEIAKLEKGQYTSALGTKNVQVAVNPTNITDLSKTTWAVINKYGDTAPLALSNAKPLTRANDANTYTLDIKSAIKDASTIKSFEKDFASADKGNMATLKAGLVTASFEDDFVTFDKTKNADKAEFAATVKYGDYSGSVELEAVKDAQFVYAAYILDLGSETQEHDSLLWDLNYEDLTLTYDADNVKKIMADAEEDMVFTVTVKQINPNGYIHNTDAKITFEAKEDDAIVIEKELILSGVTHKVQVLKVDKDNNPLQIEKISKDAILEKLGYKKGSKDSIHFAHSEITGVEILDAYLGASGDGEVDKLPKNADGKFTFAEVSSTTNDFTFKFAEDYAVAAFTTAKKVDVAQGKTVNVILEVTMVDDKDIEGKITTKYNVTLPLTFDFPKVDEMYSWNPSVAANGSIEYIDKAIINKKEGFTYVQTGFEKILMPGKTEGKVAADSIYVPSSLKAELAYSNLKSYKEKLAEIEEMQVSTSFTAAAKQAKKDSLNAAFLNTVQANNSVYQKTVGNVAGYWKYSETTGSTEETMINSVSVTPGDMLANTTYSYTIKGMIGKVLDREIPLAARTVTVKAAGEATMELSTVELTTGADSTYLYNALYVPAVAENWNGTFKLTNANGKTLDIATAANTYVKVDAIQIIDGKPVTGTNIDGSTTATPNIFGATVQEYVDNTQAAGKHNGLRIYAPAAASGKTYELTIKLSTSIANVGTAAGDLTFKVIVNVK